MSNVNPESGSKSLETDRERLTARQLVDVIFYVGPGGSVKVRAHSKEGDATLDGRTSWNTELADHGPAVISYRDGDEDWIEAVIPLGGHTATLTSRYDSHRLDHRVAPIIVSGVSPTVVHTLPINPMAEQWEFEIIAEPEKS